MPIEPFLPQDEAEPIEGPSEFCCWVQDTLEALQDEEYRRLFVPELIGPMKAAWIHARPRFEEVQALLAQTQLDQIELHGLSGPELDFKLKTVRYWAGRFIEGGSAVVLRRLLDSIDTLLVSLLDAIGGGGAVQEIKDAIRDAIAD